MQRLDWKRGLLPTALGWMLVACGLLGCGGSGSSTPPTASTPTAPDAATPAAPLPSAADRVMRSGAATAGDWLTFTLNVQDFAYPDRSAATVDRVITLHEQYKVPVDIYLTDNALPHFIIRPDGSVTDLVTGLPTSATGGFTRLKQLTGSNAVIAAFQADAALYPSVSQVFRELGASMGISHSAPYINLGAPRALRLAAVPVARPERHQPDRSRVHGGAQHLRRGQPVCGGRQNARQRLFCPSLSLDNHLHQRPPTPLLEFEHTGTPKNGR